MIRTTVLAIAMAATGFSTVTAQAAVDTERHQTLKQELKAMNEVLETKLGQQLEQSETAPSWMRHGRLNHTYLAGQGVVYEVHLPGAMGMHWRHAMAHMKQGADGAKLPKLKEVNSVVSDIVSEIKEQRAVIRDVHKERGQTDGVLSEAQRKELELAKARLKDARERLAEERQLLHATAEEMRDKHQKMRQESFEKIQQQVANFEQTLAETLCTYGASLTALPNDESISVVVKGGGERKLGGRDKVYIFNHADILACGNADNAGALLQQAVTYSY